jgi:hypothetical protein
LELSVKGHLAKETKEAMDILPVAAAQEAAVAQELLD